MQNFHLTDDQIKRYHDDGFLLVKSLFDAEETGILRTAARADKAMRDAAMDLKDGEGGVAKLSVWNYEGDDIYGLVSRSQRVVDAMEQLLGGEVYHYHSKMSIKEPYTGGAWAWHQDYGYWYNNGCLLPLMSSCFIAVDPNTRENGCMQLIKASHLMGRIEHGTFGDQTGADPERVNAALARMELVYAVMDPGDALFFHCNALHRSDQNKSPNPRWSLICCYNAARNDPYKDSHHPRYHKLDKVPNAWLKAKGAHMTSNTQSFLKMEDDTTIGHETKTVG